MISVFLFMDEGEVVGVFETRELAERYALRYYEEDFRVAYSDCKALYQNGKCPWTDEKGEDDFHKFVNYELMNGDILYVEERMIVKVFRGFTNT